MLGFEPLALQGKNVMEFVHLEDRQEVKRFFLNLKKQPYAPLSLEYRIKNSKGEFIWIESNARNRLATADVRCIVMDFRNIQAKKTADHALLQVEQRLSLLLNNTEESFIVLNSRLRIITYNKAAQEQSPYFFKNPLQSGISFLDLVNKEEREEYVNVFEEVFQGKEIIKETYFNNLAEAGPVYSHKFRPLLNQENDILGVFITSNNITTQKKIESEQKALTDELIRNNRDLRQFSYITSHNLRAPVANLISLLTLYNHANPLDEFNEVLIEKFGEATRQLSQTLNDLFDVLVIRSNNNNIDSEIVSFSNIYNEVFRNINNLLKQQKGVIQTDFSCINEISGNRVHLESIFLNMISNAIRYSSPKRSLEINIRSYKEESYAIVEFADNGLGIDLKRYGDRLFGLYQRFHDNKDGKGLGLYMTKAQVVAMGGKIEIESEPEKGTTFRIYFKMKK